MSKMKTTAHPFDIAESSKKIGQLTPRLLDKFGNEIDGKHRNAIDPNWKSITLENIDTPEKLIIARFVANYHRRNVSDPEIKQTLNALLKLYSEQKMLDKGQPVHCPKDQTDKQQHDLLVHAADTLGVSYRTIIRYADPTFKRPKKIPIKKTQSKVEQSFAEKSSKQEMLAETPNIATTCLCSKCKVKTCEKKI